ncbi:unnamed protein product, partial [Effrenium voratum]
PCLRSSCGSSLHGKMQWGKVVSQKAVPAKGSTPIGIEVSELPSGAAARERNLEEGIKSLYQTCQLYDLNLVVGKTRLPAHKVVLAALSRACCEEVRKAVAEYSGEGPDEKPKDRLEAQVPREEVQTSPAEAKEPEPAAGAPEAKKPKEQALALPAKETEEQALLAEENEPEGPAPPEVAASPAVYSNQWKASEKSDPSPTSPSEASVTEVKPRPERPEMVLDIASPEAARALLDMVYGLGSEYHIHSDEANEDVLRLSRLLDVPCLQELATRYLAENLTTENAVARLQTCRQFGLEEMYEAIEQEVVMNREALEQVAAEEEVMKHPAILQSLLVRSARMHRPMKRGLPESQALKVRPEKMPKVSSSRGGA